MVARIVPRALRILLGGALSLAIGPLEAQAGAHGKLVLRGGHPTGIVTLGNLALSPAYSAESVAGSGAIIGATAGSTLTLTSDPSGKFSLNSGARTFSWTSTIAQPSYSLGITETLAGASNTPKLNTLTFTVNAAGSYNDGSTYASTGGTALYPHIYDSNAGTQTYGVAVPNRPTEAVPDVDYAIGPDAGSITKHLPADAGLLPSCVDLDGRGWLQLNANCTLTGWDFAGYGLVNYGGYNVYVENCSWDNSNSNATYAIPFYKIYGPNTGNGNLTVRKCEFHGNYHGESYVIMVPDGNTLIELNRFDTGAADFLDFGSRGGTTSAIVRWNSMRDLGADWQAHGDFTQLFTGGTPQFDWNGIQIYGNLMIQSPANASHQAGASNSLNRAGDLNGAHATIAFHHNYALGFGFTHAGNNGLIPAAERDDYPSWINLIQGGGDAGIGYNQITLSVDYNHFFAESGPWNATDRTIYGIWSQGHWTNTTVTSFTGNKKDWDNSAWPTIP